MLDRVFRLFSFILLMFLATSQCLYADISIDGYTDVSAEAVSTNSVPEPSANLLIAVGFAICSLRRTRKRFACRASDHTAQLPKSSMKLD